MLLETSFRRNLEAAQKGDPFSTRTRRDFPRTQTPQRIGADNRVGRTRLNSQVSSCSGFSEWDSRAGQPVDEYLHGKKTELATFSIARLRMLPARGSTGHDTPARNSRLERSVSDT